MKTHQSNFLKLVYSRPEPGTARRKAGPAAQRIEAGRSRPGDDPHFTGWIEEYLQEMYADILKEPIPGEIIGIINKESKTR